MYTAPLPSVYLIERFFPICFSKRSASELLSGDLTKGQPSAGPKRKSGAQREEFELILVDPLLKDGFMCWPLGEVTTVGFMPGNVLFSCIFFCSRCCDPLIIESIKFCLHNHKALDVICNRIGPCLKNVNVCSSLSSTISLKKISQICIYVYLKNISQAISEILASWECFPQVLKLKIRFYTTE